MIDALARPGPFSNRIHIAMQGRRNNKIRKIDITYTIAAAKPDIASVFPASIPAFPIQAFMVPPMDYTLHPFNMVALSARIDTLTASGLAPV
ncbi:MULTISPECIES: hypothetical protein [Ralstonia solanacearum species complex]|uniref:hypothetical protein n=1 Tax=Ralstonia solanacearum species complex TaxID=3116862 RepID=UPI0011126E26|nr:hypothetical protein [Ralstonia solanacearum]MDN4064763.1 hypothetical protein [Ralstonia solanacearum]NUU72296.1 hypothetical protein [Ralstonia solanacearum]QHB61492.1 hypothetical protein GRD98_21455 [Ralstonia solanacearum]